MSAMKVMQELVTEGDIIREGEQGISKGNKIAA